MSLREWLIAIGALIIVGIVIDGIRRMHRARKEAMAISSGMGADDIDQSPIDEEYNPELPNGGARPLSNPSEGDGERARAIFDKPEHTFKPTRPVVDRFPGASGDAGDAHSDSDLEAPLSAIDESSDDHLSAEPLSAAGGDAPTGDQGPAFTETDDDARWLDGGAGEPEMATAAQSSQPSGTDPNRPVAGANRPEAEEVLVINVLSETDSPFQGKALKKLLEACGLEYGDLGIYHRHEESDTTSPVQFSVASAVEPGTFHPQDMETMSTPGLSFFMSLPGPNDSMQAFEFMLETARAVVSNLGGEMKDEGRSVMTPQTIEHCRQRIREYERKRRFRQYAH